MAECVRSWLQPIPLRSNRPDFFFRFTQIGIQISSLVTKSCNNWSV